MNPADPTHTTGARPTDARTGPVSIAEIADFLRQLRGLSTPSPPAIRGSAIPGSQPAPDPERDPAAERAAFLARKADLFTRIAAPTGIRTRRRMAPRPGRGPG